MLSFQLTDLQITDGKRNDVLYWRQENFTWGKNNLWIADLGHFSWEVFHRIAERESYFLSRYKSGTTLYLKNSKGHFVPLDIEQYVQSIAAGSTVQAVAVYFGKEKAKARLLCEAVPEPLKEQRLANYRQRYQRQSKAPGKHWEMTHAKELLCGYNLYLTNAPEEKLKDEDVFFIYGLRWSRLRRETAL